MPGRPYLDFYSLVMQDYTFERVLDEVADGDTIAAIQRRVTARAEELFPGKMATFEHGPVFSRQMLYMWMDMKAPDNVPGPDGKHPRRKAYVEARYASADSLVDSAADDLERATSETIPVVREQVKHKVWRAGKFNRDEYGEKPMEVNLNLGTQHLDALRLRVVVPETPALPPPADYEIVEGDDATHPR